jgi:acetolactate synthase-1/2/3 large subunit
MATTAKEVSNTATDTLAQKNRSGEVVSGCHLVAKALKNEGVDTIFTLCGGHIIDIYDGCIDEGIKIVDVRHEQVAAHAADGYARQTGRLGCVVTTAGPGCTTESNSSENYSPRTAKSSISITPVDSWFAINRSRTRARLSGR